MAFLIRAPPPANAGGWFLRKRCRILLSSADKSAFGGVWSDLRPGEDQESRLTSLKQTLRTAWKIRDVQLEELASAAALSQALGVDAVNLLPELTVKQRNRLADIARTSLGGPRFVPRQPPPESSGTRPP